MKKLLSIILVLAMIASLFANVGVVFAEGNYVAKVGDVYFEDIFEAWNYALSIEGATVELLDNVDLNESLVNPGITGEGTEASPYLIDSLTALKWFRDDVNAGNNYAGKYIKLTANIDLGGEEWEPIGYMGKNFVGNFDGDNHTISNLVITKTLDNTSANNGIGFFGRTDSPAVIKNLTIENVDITGSLYVGAVVGHGYTGKAIENVTVKGNIAIDAWWYAGVIGGNGYMSLVNNCHVIGNDGSYIKGNDGSYIGGIWGFRGEGDNKITNCTVTNLDITGVDRVGGICGIGHYGNTVSGCAVDSVSIEATDPDATTVGLIVGACQGNTSSPSVFKENTVTETTAKAGDTVVESIYGTNIDGSTAVTNYVVSIGNKVYETLKAAIADLKDGDTLVIADNVTLSEGSIKLPATLKNVTIKGGTNSVLKDMKLMSADGNSVDYEGLTIDGIIFDNSNIVLTGWRTKVVIYKDIAITNCIFKNVVRTNNEAAVHINCDAKEAIENFTFTNNVIDGVSGASNSGLYLQATGEIKVENNVINNVAFRPYVIQLTSDDGVSDNFVVTGNTFSGSAVGRAQGLSNNAEGTDSVNIVVSNNIFKDITDSQQICYWNFNAEKTSATLSNNYYDIDINENPQKIYFNGSAQSKDDLYEMGVYPIYTELNEDGTINTESVYTYVPVSAVATVDGVGFADLQAAIDAANGKTVVLVSDVVLEGSLTIAKDTVVTLDLAGYEISGVDTTEKNFGLINNNGTLTIYDTKDTGKIILSAKINSGWNRYSAVISNNPGGTLTVNGGALEHLGGTDMAYGIDSLTNGNIGDVKVTINGGSVTSTYRAIRQFLNSDSKQNELVINGGTITGAKQAIFFHDPSKKANNGKLTITENATIDGGVYLFVTEGSTEWPVEVSIAAAAIKTGEVTSKNVPEGYEVKEENGTYGVVEVEYNTWDTKGGFIKGLPDENNSITMLLVVGIQGRSYAEAGFEVTVGDTVVDVPTNFVYTKINIKDANGNSIGDPLVGATFGENNDYILCAKVLLPTDFDGADISFRAYLVDYEGNKMYAKNTNGSLDYVGTIGRVVDN